MGGYRIPYVSRPYGGDSRIPEMMLRAGNVQAEARYRNAENLGGLISGAGQAVGGALDEQSKAKQKAERDHAWVEAIQSGQLDDPKTGLLTAVKLFGNEGLGQYNAYLQAKKLSQGEVKNPQEAQLYLGNMAKKLATLDDGAIAKLWPAIAPLGKSAGLPVPDQYTPEFRPQLESFAALGDKEATPKTREIRLRNPDGSESVQVVEDKPGFSGTSAPEPPKPVRPQVVGRALVGDAGNVIYRDPEPAREPGSEPLETVIENGVAVYRPRSQAVGKPAASTRERAATGQERNVLAFYNRAQKAVEDIAPLEEKIANSGLMDQARLEYGGNLMQSAEQQQYRQAQRAFTEARLRKESGAAIPPEEYKNDARTYFQQPGDSPEVVAQKHAARQVVLDGLRYSSGKAYDEYYGEPAPTPKNQGQGGSGAKAAPAIGSVVKGYKFKGGDPADKANWEKVQ